MRGQVLHYDETQGFGFITGADGKSYTFGREDLRRAQPMTAGATVEFQPHGGQARDIFPVRAGIVPSVPAVEASAARVPPAGQPAASRASVPSSAHFGRYATPGAALPSGSLWGYFWQGLTENYVNFRGRARRKEFWGFWLFLTIAFIAVTGVSIVADGVAGNFDPNGSGPILILTLPGLLWLATFLPSLAMMIRRQHDIGLSGWFYLVILIPYIGSLILFVFSLIPSQLHENRWGPVPEGIAVPPPFIPTAPGTSA